MKQFAQIVYRRLRATSAFSPRNLFAQGEQGAWYDPSDLTTLFQDAAGTTPVTAAGQPVGLVLDKRLGLGIGTELVSNNTFATDTVWSKGTGWTIGSGVATKAAGTASVLSQTITLEAGVSYRIVYTTTRTAGSLTPRFTGGTTVSGTARSASGTYVDVLAALSGNTTLEFSADSAFAGTVDNVYVKRVSGNDAFQVLDTQRPTYRVASGRPYLEFDGTDDSLSTATINPGSVDKAQIFAGVTRQTTDAARMVAEYSPSSPLNAGSLYVMVGTNPDTGAGNGFFSLSRGSAAFAVGQAGISPATFTPPVTAVLAGTHDIAGDLSTMRGNGAAGTNGTVDKGTGNWGSYPLFIGRRSVAANFLNGRIYSLILRFSGANLDTATISQAETWVNGKTGAY